MSQTVYKGVATPIYAAEVRENVLFEVYAGAGEDVGRYVGFCNGERSVTADSPDLAVRGLSWKHNKAPVIDFAAAAKKRQAAENP